MASVDRLLANASSTLTMSIVCHLVSTVRSVIPLVIRLKNAPWRRRDEDIHHRKL